MSPCTKWLWLAGLPQAIKYIYILIHITYIYPKIRCKYLYLKVYNLYMYTYALPGFLSLIVTDIAHISQSTGQQDFFKRQHNRFLLLVGPADSLRVLYPSITNYEIDDMLPTAQDVSQSRLESGLSTKEYRDRTRR